ncbi:uncharacterized protein LOC133887544 [Phragmites australis]|uniref:uncharacterized protein LOC133887544 n=1 Tax=Phragmites australis TaxID=29695 RepID=UPI002D780A93|nr:uncharacterized protein LOC133887544 [Phragmites australis]XP_062183514.1 uncharacterized protein LOC133887544 [Phragmites australis]
MAEMVSSAVVQEAVSQVLSSIRDKYEGKSNAKEHMERMEMAHIKLEAALETSDKWNVTSAPLLRWRSKLKRAAQECDDTLRRCKQRSQGEAEGTEHGVRSSTFPKRIAHTAKSFVSSIFNRGDDELSGSTVRRFEWFADGASEFLRYVELGGTPRQYMFFDPLVRHLLAGKETEYSFVRGDQHLSFLLGPFSPPEHGIEGRLKFSFEDGNAPENNFHVIYTWNQLPKWFCWATSHCHLGTTNRGRSSTAKHARWGFSDRDAQRGGRATWLVCKHFL